MLHDLMPFNQSNWFSPESASWWPPTLADLVGPADHVFFCKYAIRGERNPGFAIDKKLPIGPMTTVSRHSLTLRAQRLPANAKADAGPQYWGADFVLMVSRIDLRNTQGFFLPSGAG
jgi:hypothetical protein